MGEQLGRVTRVLAGDEIDLLQHAQGTQGNILEVSDRRRNDVQPSE